MFLGTPSDHRHSCDDNSSGFVSVDCDGIKVNDIDGCEDRELIIPSEHMDSHGSKNRKMHKYLNQTGFEMRVRFAKASLQESPEPQQPPDDSV